MSRKRSLSKIPLKRGLNTTKISIKVKRNNLTSLILQNLVYDKKKTIFKFYWAEISYFKKPIFCKKFKIDFIKYVNTWFCKMNDNNKKWCIVFLIRINIKIQWWDFISFILNDDWIIMQMMLVIIGKLNMAVFIGSLNKELALKY